MKIESLIEMVNILKAEQLRELEKLVDGADIHFWRAADCGDIYYPKECKIKLGDLDRLYFNKKRNLYFNCYAGGERDIANDDTDENKFYLFYDKATCEKHCLEKILYWAEWKIKNCNIMQFEIDRAKRVLEIYDTHPTPSEKLFIEIKEAINSGANTDKLLKMFPRK